MLNFKEMLDILPPALDVQAKECHHLKLKCKELIHQRTYLVYNRLTLCLTIHEATKTDTTHALF